MVQVSMQWWGLVTVHTMNGPGLCQYKCCVRSVQLWPGKAATNAPKNLLIAKENLNIAKETQYKRSNQSPKQ